MDEPSNQHTRPLAKASIGNLFVHNQIKSGDKRKEPSLTRGWLLNRVPAYEV
jgi:hypothetical protein